MALSRRGEEQDRSRLEEMAEDVMTKEQLARQKELDDIEKADHPFEGSRVELLADELIRALPGQSRRSPKRSRHRDRCYSTSSSSEVSSSEVSSRGSFTPVCQSERQRSVQVERKQSAGKLVPAATAMPDEVQEILPALRHVVPALDAGRHKGQAGRIAVVGGCREYTGAPYFAAISALKMGADLAHVFCTKGAGTVIKSYSPELIVHPVLHESDDLGEIGEQEEADLKGKALDEVSKWLERFDCIVVGPGLGRDPLLLDCVAGIIEAAKSKNIPLVIDGDGLFLVTNQPELIVGYRLAVLTPNVMEHKRLVAKMSQDASGDPKEISDEDLPGQLQELAKKFQSAKNVKEEVSAEDEDPENPKEPSDEDPENPKEPSDEDPENPKEPSDEDPENPKEPADEDPEIPKEPSDEDPELPKEPSDEDPELPKEPSDEEEDLTGQLLTLANKFQSAKIAGEGGQDAYKEIPEEEMIAMLQELAKKMEGVTIVQKGKTDYISDGRTVLSSNYFGSPRRCGGQGDVLSGSTAVFVSWAKQYFNNKNAEGKEDVLQRVSDNPTMVGALAGSLLCRKSAANAFAQHKRSTVTTDIIECLGFSMDELFPI